MTNKKPFLIILMPVCIIWLQSSSLCIAQVKERQGGSADRFSVEFSGEINGKGHGKKGMGSNLERILIGEEAVSLSRPMNLITDENNIWIVSQDNGLVIKSKEGRLEIPAGFKRKKLDFPSLVGIARTPEGDLLISDSKLNKIYSLSSDGKRLSCINDSLRLDQPTGIAYSLRNRELWISETGKHRITITDLKGRIKRTIGKRGTLPGEFNFPTSVWIDKDGTAYVVDALNFRIQIFDSNGNFISTFGKAGDATGYFARPKGISTDSFGNIYVSDALFNAVQVFDRNGRFLYYFGKQGHDQGEFWMPGGLYIDSKDNIYVADSYNNRIQVFKLTDSQR